MTRPEPVIPAAGWHFPWGQIHFQVKSPRRCGRHRAISEFCAFSKLDGMVRGTLMNLGILRVRRCFGILGVTASVLACASSKWDGQVYKSDSVTFRAGRVPAGWHRIEADNTMLAFRDVDRDLVISVNGRCAKDSDDVPLEALTQHLFMYFTERQVTSQARVNLDGREALRTELSAKLDGVPRRFVVYVIKKNGCVYDFVWIAGPTVDAAGKAEFDLFVMGFSTNTPR